MPAAEEPLEDGLYSKFHNLLPWQFVLRFRTPSCMRTLALWVNENSSACRKTSEELPVYLLLGAITLASLLRPRGAERVEYEGIRYSQRGGIYNNLVGIKNLCVERHAPGLVQTALPQCSHAAWAL